MKAILRRELGAYFKGMTGYLITAFVLLFAGIYAMAYNLSGRYANFEYVLDAISFIYLIAVPILSMRSLAEERRQKTDQLLYAMPIGLGSVVMGKYLAMLVVLLVPCAVLALYPLVLTQFGQVSLGAAYGALLGFFALGAALLSVGLFVSSATESQVASAVVTLAAMLLLYFMTSLSSFVSGDASASLAALLLLAVLAALIFYRLSKNAIVAACLAAACAGGLLAAFAADRTLFEGLFATIMTQLSVFDRFYGFVDGVFDLRAIVYDASFAAVFLFMTVQSMEKRRWSE